MMLKMRGMSIGGIDQFNDKHKKLKAGEKRSFLTGF